MIFIVNPVKARVLKKILSRWRIFGSRRRHMSQSAVGVSWGGSFEILDGRRCNLCKYIYLREMKLLIGLKKCRFFREKLKKSKLQSKCHKIRTD
jgi:hypothetical protein